MAKKKDPEVIHIIMKFALQYQDALKLSKECANKDCTFVLYPERHVHCGSRLKNFKAASGFVPEVGVSNLKKHGCYTLFLC